ncbi:MAG: putative baseplate assembly protein, partial [Sulfurifustaceae bacterium]
KRGRVAKGFAVKYSPLDGGAPVVFETLADLDVDAALNELRLTAYDRSPAAVTGNTLALEKAVAGLKLGEPIVLENERTGFTLVRLIAGIEDSDGRTVLKLHAPVGTGPGFQSGELLIHLKPTDKLTPLGPVQTDATAAMIGDKLFLTTPPRLLSGGDVAYIADGTHAYYRRVRSIDGVCVQIDSLLDGPLHLDSAYVSRARQVSVARVDGRDLKTGGGALFSFQVAGDFSSFGPPTLIADYVVVSGSPQLRRFAVKTAKYHPPAANDPFSGYTVITVEDPDKLLDNPQAMYFPAPSREWTVDTYLYDASGLLPLTVVSSLPKSASSGDFAVVVSGEQLGWAKLENVATDTEAGRAELSVARWYTRASGRFYLSRTRIYSRFKEQTRLLGWNENETPVSGATLPLAAVARPELLIIGRRLWIERREAVGAIDGREAAVLDLTENAIVVDPPLPAGEGFTIGNTIIRGNVVTAGHGETQTERILGSGDAASLNQSFLLAVTGVSFVADPTFPAGVRADLNVIIDGRKWQQVGNLDDSGPGDPHYVVRMTEEGYVRIEFGDGARGRRLPSGTNNVRVRYRLGTGLAGNVPARSLEKPARPHPLVDKPRQPLAASGGGDMESVEALKRNAPPSVLTLERAVSAEDYGHLTAAHAAVWRARAFPRPSALKSARIEVVVVPAGGATLDERLQATLENFLTAHSQPGVDVSVTEFGRVYLHLDVLVRVVSTEFDPQVVKAQAAARLKEMFALERRDIGAPLYLSDVYAIVEAVPGVSNSSCALSFEIAGGTVKPGGQRVSPGSREVVFLDTAARPGALRIEHEEFDL